jgi:hypothetical protein
MQKPNLENSHCVRGLITTQSFKATHKRKTATIRQQACYEDQESGVDTLALRAGGNVISLASSSLTPFCPS